MKVPKNALPGSFGPPGEGQDRLATEQRRAVPVDDRADIVLVKYLREPLQIDVGRFAEPRPYVFRGSFPYPLASRIEVAVLLPDSLPGCVLRMFSLHEGLLGEAAYRRFHKTADVHFALLEFLPFASSLEQPVWLIPHRRPRPHFPPNQRSKGIRQVGASRIAVLVDYATVRLIADLLEVFDQFLAPRIYHQRHFALRIP